MAVEVRITASLQKLVDGQRSIATDGSTISECLAQIEASYPGLQSQLMTDGELHRFVNIYRNDEDIRFLSKLETPVSDGDTISILPALAGGN